MKAFWNWLNGKKTAISIIYGAIITYLHVSGFLGTNELILLSTIGGVLFGIGVGDKISKALAKKTQDNVPAN